MLLASTFPRILCRKVSACVMQTNERDSPVIFTTSLGLLFAPVGEFSIFRSVSIPSMTLPKTTCFPSRKSHFAVVMKNYPKVSRGSGKGDWEESYLTTVRVWARVCLINMVQW